MSAVGSFIAGGSGAGVLVRELGRFINPSAPGVGRPKAPKSLGRLSLAQLTRIRDRTAKKKRRGEKVLGELQQQEEPTGTGFAAVGRRALQGRIRQQGRDIKRTGRRLSKVGEARQNLIRRQTAARTGRATAISTLLTRGI